MFKEISDDQVVDPSLKKQLSLALLVLLTQKNYLASARKLLVGAAMTGDRSMISLLREKQLLHRDGAVTRQIAHIVL